MSAMKDLAIDIEQLWYEGNTAAQIVRQLNCPKELVFDWIAERSIRPFDQWAPDAQQRLINDVFSPFETINS